MTGDEGRLERHGSHDTVVAESDADLDFKRRLEHAAALVELGEREASLVVGDLQPFGGGGPFGVRDPHVLLVRTLGHVLDGTGIGGTAASPRVSALK